MAFKRSVFPENGYDVFQELYDIPPSKVALVQEFQSLKVKPNKNITEQNRLNELTNELQLYIIDPDKWNLFCDAVTGLQKFFLENVNNYIDAMQLSTEQYMDWVRNDALNYLNARKQDMDNYKNQTESYMNARKQDMDSYKVETQEYMELQKVQANQHVNAKKSEMDSYVVSKQNEVNIHVSTEKQGMTNFVNNKKEEFDTGISRFNYKGNYNPSTTYSQWNAVKFDGNLFISKTDNNRNNQPPTASDENTHWYKATEKGSRGQDGTNLVYKGLYNNSISYNAGDLVNYNGVLYYAKSNATGVLPTNTATWEIFPINVTTTIQPAKPSNNYSGHIWLETL